MSLFDLHLKSKSEPVLLGLSEVRMISGRCVYIYPQSLSHSFWFLYYFVFVLMVWMLVTCTVSKCIIIQCKQLDNDLLASDPQASGSAIRLCYRCSRPGDQQSISIIFSLPLQITKEGSTQKSQTGIDALSAVSYGWSMSVAVPYSLISRLLDSHSSKPQNNG